MKILNRAEIIKLNMLSIIPRSTRVKLIRLDFLYPPFKNKKIAISNKITGTIKVYKPPIG